VALVGFVGLVIAESSTACSSSKSCTPGQSIACTGPGGCTGGQACNADGTGYGACACEGTDSGPPSDASNDVASDGAVPTHGALHVTWTITQNSNAATCAQVGGATVEVIVTSPDGGVSKDQSFPCTAGTGDLTGLAFDTYAVSATLLDSQSLSLGGGAPQNVTLGATGCDSIISGDCAKTLSANFSF
jgi:hypothetical protein